LESFTLTTTLKEVGRQAGGRADGQAGWLTGRQADRQQNIEDENIIVTTSPFKTY
jgi:hypothetical protein